MPTLRGLFVGSLSKALKVDLDIVDKAGWT